MMHGNSNIKNIYNHQYPSMAVYVVYCICCCVLTE